MLIQLQIVGRCPRISKYVYNQQGRLGKEQKELFALLQQNKMIYKSNAKFYTRHKMPHIYFHDLRFLESLYPIKSP